MFVSLHAAKVAGRQHEPEFSPWLQQDKTVQTEPNAFQILKGPSVDDLKAPVLEMDLSANKHPFLSVLLRYFKLVVYPLRRSHPSMPCCTIDQSKQGFAF